MSMAGETIRIGSRTNRAIAIAMSRVNLGKAHRSDSGTSDSIAIRRLGISRPLAISSIADAVSDGGGVEISSGPGTAADSIADSIRRLSIGRPLAIGSVADAVSDGGGVEISRSPVAESIAVRRLSLPLSIANAEASIAAVSETKTLGAPLGAAHSGGVKSHSIAIRGLSLPLAVSLGGPRLGVDSAIRVIRESSQSNTTVQTDSIRGLSLPLAVSSVSIPKSIPDRQSLWAALSGADSMSRVQGHAAS